MNSDNQKILDVTWHVIATGDVQGVGFRYTTQKAARHLGVKGNVRNLADGSVEIYARASEETLELFLTTIQAKTSGHVDAFQKNLSQAVLDDDSFHIL